MKKIQIRILFWSSRKMTLMSFVWFSHLFNYLTRFWLFLVKTQFLERQISGCEWENMNPLLVLKSQTCWGKVKGSHYIWFTRDSKGHSQRYRPEVQRFRTIMRFYTVTSACLVSLSRSDSSSIFKVLSITH